MIREVTLQEAAEMTGGQLRGGNAGFSAVSIDTRTLQPGELFIAIAGPRFDGNEFVQQAAEKGAAGALVSRDLEAALPLVRVEDGRLALGRLGAYNRRLCAARVVALTGSQGKTTVKEMTAAILARRGPMLVTRGNLNNDIGVPLTLLRIEKQHRFAVIEMGANAPGEIAYTTSLVQPDIAHITNIAPTHLEGFGSLAGVAEAKGEIWRGLRKDGTAVLSLDDPYVELWRQALEGRNVATISPAGRAEADYRVSASRLDPREGARFTLHTPNGEGEMQLALLGSHNVANALAAAALAMEAGAGFEDVRAGLAEMRPVPGRLCLKPGRGGATIIDDSYNASPSSFRAAIDVLSAFPGERIVAAGDMGELGSEEVAAHAELGRYARERGIERLFAAGRLSAGSAQSFGPGAVHKASRDELAAEILPLLGPGVTVLVKGSRSAGMDRLVQQLIPSEE